ncbi:histidine kinase [Hymenobacter sp. BT664]|uniref:Histidine kinase n=1 Tax=Hymenobacter montanus TaxID=2771359 RepID=A0A927BBZ3_9BACT|nr:histidine kinase [Hymenobacter montanus]MBD2767977.1 histidine kinase [Hymenobacter montanus]
MKPFVSGKLPAWLTSRGTLHGLLWAFIIGQTYTYWYAGHAPGQPLRQPWGPLLLIASYMLPVLVHDFVLLARLFRPGGHARYFGALVALIGVNSLLSVPALNALIIIKTNLFQHLFNTAGFLIISSILRFYRRNVQQQIDFQELQANQARAELHVLKAQINPHFLFNTLNSLYSLALDNSPQTPDVVLKLADLMRYILEQTAQPQVLLAQELAHLDNYLWLEKLRLGRRATVALDVQGPTDLLVAPMLLLPFVENSFKHGASQLAEHVRVHIAVQTAPTALNFVIENNKPAQAAPPLAVGPSRTPVGLRNVQRRLELLYPGRYTLELDNQPALYRARLHLDLR